MSLRTKKKQETRRRILTEATSLIGKVGFGCFRTVDIAKASEVSHGALFVHFETRSDLALGVAKKIGLEITDRLHALVSAKRSFQSVLRAHAACLAEHEEGYRCLIRERHLLPREFNTCWAGLQSAASEHIWRAAKLEINLGKIRKVPQYFLFNSWIGLVHHYVLNRELFVSDDSSVLEKHGANLAAQFTKLLTNYERNLK